MAESNPRRSSGRRAGRGPSGKTRRARRGARKTLRVAIIGGGCAGLAAAWQLSKYPGYEVHVYEKSFRLGGKGASGRDDEGQIREHGLHTWLGFYENAFRMMRECYAEVVKNKWGPGAPAGSKLAHGSLQDAFVPEPHIGVFVPNSRLDPEVPWTVWSGFLPPAQGMPGDDLNEETNPFTLSNYLLRCLELLKTLMQSVIGPGDGPVPGRPGSGGRSPLDRAIESDFDFDPARSPETLLDLMMRYLRGGTLTTAAGLLQGLALLTDWVEDKASVLPHPQPRVLQFVRAVAEQIRKQLLDLVSIDPRIRWKTEVIDIVLTISAGLFRDRVLFSKKGFDAINHIDYREWLKNHGATSTALASRFLTAFYDLTFSYEDGDRGKSGLAAGVALRGALRMFFTYRGSMFWRMRSGMGDAVFAPLYKALALRPAAPKRAPGTAPRAVTFHFQHELSLVDFRFDKDARYVSGLHFVTTGDPAQLDALGAAALDPFGCWPDDARMFKGAGSGTGTVDLEAGTHFDAVIFATGIDDFAAVCDKSGFFQKMPAWDDMRKGVKTVATQAAQVWMNRSIEELGWRRGSGIFTAFEPPLETWADMTGTFASEKAWRAANARGPVDTDNTRSIAYFCSVLPKTDEAAGEQKVRENLDALLARRIKPLWPAAFENGKTAASYEIDRCVKANVSGSERYTLSLPNSIACRISPLDVSVLNMSIAGDWTASGLDAGCVEGAVMSGMLAAFAISSEAAILKSIIGYDHP